MKYLCFIDDLKFDIEGEFKCRVWRNMSFSKIRKQDHIFSQGD